MDITLEVPRGLPQCFYEDIDLNTRIGFDFKIMLGNEVYFEVTGPSGILFSNENLKDEMKELKRPRELTTKDRGQYSFCFEHADKLFEGNKVLWFRLEIGEEEKLTDEMAMRATALTQVESSCVGIHESLVAVQDIQTYYRLREYKGRAIAEDVHERVHWWSIGECLVLVVLSGSQVFIVRSFFSNKPNRLQPRF
jgi:hypothetical protein